MSTRISGVACPECTSDEAKFMVAYTLHEELIGRLDERGQRLVNPVRIGPNRLPSDSVGEGRYVPYPQRLTRLPDVALPEVFALPSHGEWTVETVPASIEAAFRKAFWGGYLEENLTQPGLCSTPDAVAADFLAGRSIPSYIWALDGLAYFATSRQGMLAMGRSRRMTHGAIMFLMWRVFGGPASALS